jgi:hypothetical protein
VTVALTVVTSDGIVSAADSRTTWGGVIGQPRVLSDFTNKVFKVNDLVVTTYGWAMLQKRNIAAHMADFARETGTGATLAVVAQELADFMGARIDQHVEEGLDPAPPEGADELGFLVAGYDGSGEGKVLEVLLPSRQVVEVVGPGGGAAWRGQTDVIVRLVKGMDGACLAMLAERENKAEHFAELEPIAPQLEYIIPFNSMNLQDGIDFATLCIRTTIDVQRLTYGTFAFPGSWPGVGGPIQMAVVRADDGFEWVQRTTLQGERRAGDAEGGILR